MRGGLEMCIRVLKAYLLLITGDLLSRPNPARLIAREFLTIVLLERSQKLKSLAVIRYVHS